MGTASFRIESVEITAIEQDCPELDRGDFYAHWVVTVAEAQLAIDHLRDDYNTQQHPHGSLGRPTASEFAAGWKE